MQSTNGRVFRVFVSSVRTNMDEVRKSVFNSLLSLGHLPVGMEYFGYSGSDAMNTIEKAIAQSDLFILLLGNRYGTIRQEHGKSYIELEYDIATVMRKPILAYVENEANSSENQDKKLLAFKARVKDRAYEPCESLKIVSANIYRDIPKAIDRHGTSIAGLVPYADLFGIMRKNDTAMRVVDDLSRFDKLYERYESEPDDKDTLAKYFWAVLGPELYSMGTAEEGAVKLFLDSGSTITYIAEKINRILSRVQVPLDVYTNNVLAYLELVFPEYPTRSHIRVRLLHGKPDRTYGATYGSISGVPDILAPRQDELREEAKREIEAVAAQIRQEGGERLIVAATSGMQLKTNVSAELGAHKVTIKLGPHVGSYRNMLFKRALLETGFPIVWCFDGSKIDHGFEPTRCFSVAQSDDEWVSFCKSKPIAVCFTTGNNDEKEVIAKFKSFGLTLMGKTGYIYKDNQPYFLFNKLFKEKIDVSDIDAVTTMKKPVPRTMRTTDKLE